MLAKNIGEVASEPERLNPLSIYPTESGKEYPDSTLRGFIEKREI